MAVFKGMGTNGDDVGKIKCGKELLTLKGIGFDFGEIFCGENEILEIGRTYNKGGHVSAVDYFILGNEMRIVKTNLERFYIRAEN